MLLTIILILFAIFALLLVFINLSGLVGFLLTRVPFQPTYKSDVEFFVKELGISPADNFYDLGSGDGKVVFLVEKLTGAKTVGYELASWTHWLAKIKKLFKKSHAQFHNQNFFKHDWQDASYIYAYLFPPLMGRVEEKFLADCKPGSIAIVRDFPFPKLKPAQVYYRPKKHEIYIYKKL